MHSTTRFQAAQKIPGSATCRPANPVRTIALAATVLCLLWSWHPPLRSVAAEKVAPPADRSATKLLADKWDVVTIGGTRVGFGHTRSIAFQENGRQLNRTEMLLTIKMTRLGQTVVTAIDLHSVETPQGELVRTRTRVTLGPTPVVAVGQVEDDQLKIRFSSLGKTTTSTLPWSPEYGGFFALEQSLKKKPLQPGQRRQLKALVPVFNQVADLQLVAEDYQQTKMLDGRLQRLLKINTVTRLGIVEIQSTMWTDPQGEVLKMYEPATQQETFRTSRQVALQDTEGIGPDLLVSTLIPVQGLEDADRAKSVRYRVTVAGGQPVKIFPSSASQATMPAQEDQALVTVHRLKVKAKNQIDPQRGDQPTPQDRASNNWIQSDHPEVLRLAGEVLPEETSHGLLAVALERKVHQLIRKKDFTTALATAAEVARSRQGDCTEHAVLLAAMARARGIPARVVVGLVYVPALGAFGYHMWNELWIDGAWLPLDATQGEGGTGVGHIKLAHSNLNVGAAAFLPVIQVMGRLDIEVEQVEQAIKD
ncbi:MAG: hypothetical protein GTO53_05240 [Planctomycetales bacterium]|nr:hypothetical protein [Planctomycetales bacterium]NIM08555.1 hypothetical protein [Planctomycetales bacterium]NIN08024.1 hypothetical protein [Planctomycetales bacterium]NIN77162.1 hypothetical protein [Planctomycetales bacterium]NIO34344.1 hypothetical protein [Planctomycetales bacterium]